MSEDTRVDSTGVKLAVASIGGSALAGALLIGSLNWLGSQGPTPQATTPATAATTAPATTVTTAPPPTLEPTSSPEATVDTPPPAASAPPTKDPRCIPVPPGMPRAVLDGGEGLTPEGDAWAVRSETGAYFIAIRFSGSGAESDIGVWQSGSLDVGQSPIGSVNAFAKRFTQWPDTGNAGSRVASQAEGCAR